MTTPEQPTPQKTDSAAKKAAPVSDSFLDKLLNETAGYTPDDDFAINPQLDAE